MIAQSALELLIPVFKRQLAREEDEPSAEELERWRPYTGRYAWLSADNVLVIEIIKNRLMLTTLSIVGAIVTGASLSFLGLGVRPPTPEWGAMLSDGRDFMRNAWWISVFPGMVITLVVLAANIVGDALRDALDPKVRAR